MEIIAHCVWLYHRFPLSFREVEELMLERGVLVPTRRSAAGARSSGRPTPTACANGLRRRCVQPGDKWHLDEVFLRINGELKYLWRAVDADGNVLDILVQDRRDTAAARRFFRKLLKKT
ncbi:transposase-like protein [Streptomyces sp. TE3672]